MKTPKYLLDSDPLLTNVPQVEGNMEVTNTEWTVEELESAERQVEQVLMEEAFIEACFEEMLEEEESQWYHYTVIPTPMTQYTTTHYTTYMPNLQYTTHTSTLQFPMPIPQGQSMDTNINSVLYQCSEQFSNEQKYLLTSKLNPEAPEFIPRSVAS